MTNSWYYGDQEGAHQGPVSADELGQALERGEIDRGSLVWTQGMSGWQSLEGVEALQALLEEVPPPLPQGPPPLPAVPPPPQPPSAPTGTSAEPQADAEEDERGGSAESKPPKKTVPGPLSSFTSWLATKIGDSLWQWLIGHPAITAIFTTTIVVLVAWGAIESRPKLPEPPPPPTTGIARIDANPWGRVESIRGADGSRIDLSADRTTPFTATLPVGTYTAQVTYPPSKASKSCKLIVQLDRPATCWLDLAPMSAKSYFEKLGW